MIGDNEFREVIALELKVLLNKQLERQIRRSLDRDQYQEVESKVHKNTYIPLKRQFDFRLKRTINENLRVRLNIHALLRMR